MRTEITGQLLRRREVGWLVVKIAYPRLVSFYYGRRATGRLQHSPSPQVTRPGQTLLARRLTQAQVGCVPAHHARKMKAQWTRAGRPTNPTLTAFGSQKTGRPLDKWIGGALAADYLAGLHHHFDRRVVCAFRRPAYN
jgi:hypothetical protein